MCVKIRALDPSIYSERYYKEHAKGFKGMVVKIAPYLDIHRGMRVLDVGCGSGDLSIYIARRGANVVGIDYSKDAIMLANKNLSKQEVSIRDRVKFYRKDAKSIDYKESSFDMVVSVDVFEHLYQDELDVVMRKISKILKPDKKLVVHTEANKFYLNFMHRIYIYPVSQMLVLLNKFITGRMYPGLDKDPRNEYHKVQHVNEPTYFSLRSFFSKHKFSGDIVSVGLYKPLLGWKDYVYNVVVLLYPLSLFPPLVWFFAYDYTCVMTNDKRK